MKSLIKKDTQTIISKIEEIVYTDEDEAFSEVKYRLLDSWSVISFGYDAYYHGVVVKYEMSYCKP